MDRLAVLRPHRRLAVPFVMAFTPLTWFLARDVSMTAAEPAVASVPRFVVAATVAATASYLLAGLTVGVLSHRADSSRASTLLNPDDGTLVVFSALVVAGVGYLTASTFVTIPRWFDLFATPVGLLLGLPLVALYGGFVAVANVSPSLEWGVIPFVVVAVGLVCSVCWTFLLSTHVAAKLGRR